MRQHSYPRYFDGMEYYIEFQDEEGASYFWNFFQRRMSFLYHVAIHRQSQDILILGCSWICVTRSRVNFRCPISVTTRARGFVFQVKGKLVYKYVSFDTFLKNLDPALYKEYRLEKFKESKPRKRAKSHP